MLWIIFLFWSAHFFWESEKVPEHELDTCSVCYVWNQLERDALEVSWVCVTLSHGCFLGYMFSKRPVERHRYAHRGSGRYFRSGVHALICLAAAFKYRQSFSIIAKSNFNYKKKNKKTKNKQFSLLRHGFLFNQSAEIEDTLKSASSSNSSLCICTRKLQKTTGVDCPSSWLKSNKINITLQTFCNSNDSLVYALQTNIMLQFVFNFTTHPLDWSLFDNSTCKN